MPTRCEQFPLSQITVDFSIQGRVVISADAQHDYSLAYGRGEVLPDVVVFHDREWPEGERYWLADGFHRVLAARDATLTHINVEIHDGNRRAAILHACSANAKHGLRRSPEDLDRIITMMLQDEVGASMTSNFIATHVRTSHHRVEKVREKLRLENLEEVSPPNLTTPQIVDVQSEKLPVPAPPDHDPPSQEQNGATVGTAGSTQDGSPPPLDRRRGADGKMYPVHFEGAILCERCQRVGKVRGCIHCEEIKRATRPPAPPGGKRRRGRPRNDERIDPNDPVADARRKIDEAELQEEEELAQTGDPTQKERIKLMNRPILRWKRHLARLLLDLPETAYLDRYTREAIGRKIDGIYTELNHAIVTDPCPRCASVGCDYCRTCGFVNKWRERTSGYDRAGT